MLGLGCEVLEAAWLAKTHNDGDRSQTLVCPLPEQKFLQLFQTAFHTDTRKDVPAVAEVGGASKAEDRKSERPIRYFWF